MTDVVMAIVIATVVLVNGLAAGVLVGTQLGGFPLMETLSVERYVEVHAFFSTRYDPFMPGCLLITVFGDVAVVILYHGDLRATLCVVAALAAIGTIVISLTKNVPLNKWVQQLDPRQTPADWQERRSSWGVWNRRRTYLITVALIANCIAAAVLR
ncbi:anthrone oxygenase family protein [Nocardia salmonicida]|uniref:anthrone oxygenase family protein n=1 Tax=Nocardia salmonicida TaxID=53431 RepID=UPI003CEB34F5